MVRAAAQVHEDRFHETFSWEPSGLTLPSRVNAPLSQRYIPSWRTSTAWVVGFRAVVPSVVPSPPNRLGFERFAGIASCRVVPVTGFPALTTALTNCQR